MSLLKALMLCIVIAITIATPAHSEMTIAPQGGITDVLQVGRNAVIVTIDRSLLPPEIRQEVAIVTVTDAQGNRSQYECQGWSIQVPTVHLASGMCTVNIRIGESSDLDENHEFLH